MSCRAEFALLGPGEWLNEPFPPETPRFSGTPWGAQIRTTWSRQHLDFID